MKKTSLITLAALAPTTVMAHSGHHGEGILETMLHSLTHIDHLWVVVPATVVAVAGLRKVLRSQQK